jgi:predicted HicB family RNase H-like nuclease
MTTEESVDPAHYTYRVTWSAEDAEFVAVCLELPSLSWLAASPGDALAGVVKVVAEVVADLCANDEPVPVPLADRPYSGRFNVRVPESLHRSLAVEAAEQGISLNRLVSDRLART